MRSREDLLKWWADDPNITLEGMHARAQMRGYTDCTVERRATLMDFIIGSITGNRKAAPLLASIEDNTWADFYAFDVTGPSNLPATAIYDKQGLWEALAPMEAAGRRPTHRAEPPVCLHYKATGTDFGECACNNDPDDYGDCVYGDGTVKGEPVCKYFATARR
jgi:hypothetical protein